MSEIKIVSGKIHRVQVNEDTRVVVDDTYSVLVPKGMMFSTDQEEIGEDKALAIYTAIPDWAEMLDDSFETQYANAQTRVRFNADMHVFDDTIDLTDAVARKQIEDIFTERLQKALKLSGLSEEWPPFVVKSDEKAVVVANVQGLLGTALFYFILPSGICSGMYHVAKDGDPEQAMEEATPAIYKETAKKLLGTIEVMEGAADVTAEDGKSTSIPAFEMTTAASKKLTAKEVNYSGNHRYLLSGVVIPVPDGMHYAAKTLNESIPNGTTFRSGESRYGFVCYSGGKLNDLADYKDARFGLALNGPINLNIEFKSEDGNTQDYDLSSQVAKDAVASLAKQTNNSVATDICVDKVEDNFVVAHGTLCCSPDSNEYWEGFIFAAIDMAEKTIYHGIIYINAPKDRDLFYSVVHDFLIRISPISEEERRETLSQELGEYAKNGKMDALKAAWLYFKDVFWTPDDAIVSEGKHNKIKRVDGNLTEYVKYPIFAENLSVFCAEIRKVIEYAEGNSKLIIEKNKFHKDLLQISRGGNITGTICFEFFAWHMLALSPNKDSSQYTVFVDQNLWVGIPDIHGYVTELIKTLRSYNGITDPFDVKLNPTVNLDTPTPLNCKPVPGSKPLEMMEVIWNEDGVDIILGGEAESTKNPAELITMFNNHEEIEVAGTQYEGRSERIEKIKVGDRLKLVREPDNEYDKNAIDIRNEIGSLGHIPIEITEDLASLLDLGIPCAAIVTEVIPRSARGAKARKAILKVRLECKNISEVGMTGNAKEKNHKGADGTEGKALKEEKQRKVEGAHKKTDTEKKDEREEARRQYEQAHKQWEKDCEAIKTEVIK